MIKPRLAAGISIENIINHKSFSNNESAYWLKKCKWPAEDQRLYIRLLYGSLENLLIIDKIIESISGRKITKIDSTARGMIRISVYQLIFSDRIPAYAVINEAVELTKQKKPKAAGFVNAVLRGVLREYHKINDKEVFLAQYCNKNLSLQFSHSNWIIEKLKQDFSQNQVKEILKHHQEPPALTIRLNLMKGDAQSIIDQLENDGVTVKHFPWMKESYIVDKADQLITSTHAYKNGLFHIQSIVSMLAVHWLDPQPGEVVVDVAAAPGGKTTHICQQMNNQGKIFARDISSTRLVQINGHASRLGCHIINTSVKNGTEYDDSMNRKADRVLVDAPCSSMGMIRKKPELKLIYKEKDFSELPALQEKMLENSSYMVKPGGTLVYSTCTYFSNENTSVISSFLAKNPEFELQHLKTDFLRFDLSSAMDDDGMIQLGPHVHPMLDGFFVAKLVRKQV